MSISSYNIGTLAHLCLARIPLMAGDANLVEQTMQLADDGGDLLGQIARVHDCRACLPIVATMFTRSCTEDPLWGREDQARNE